MSTNWECINPVGSHGAPYPDKRVSINNKIKIKFLKGSPPVFLWKPEMLTDLSSLPEDGGVEDDEADQEGEGEDSHKVSQHTVVSHTEIYNII